MMIIYPFIFCVYCWWWLFGSFIFYVLYIAMRNFKRPPPLSPKRISCNFSYLNVKNWYSFQSNLLHCICYVDWSEKCQCCQIMCILIVTSFYKIVYPEINVHYILNLHVDCFINNNHSEKLKMSVDKLFV